MTQSKIFPFLMLLFVCTCKTEVEADFLTVNKKRFVFESPAMSERIVCSTNAKIGAVSSQPSWCNLIVVDKDKTIIIQVSKNEETGGHGRTATITVAAGKATPVQIEVIQNSREPFFSVEGDTDLQFNAKAAQRSFIVQTNLDFTVTVSSDQTWCTAQKNSGQYLVINVANNFDSYDVGTDERKAVVTVAAAGFDPVTIKITQSGYTRASKTTGIGVWYFDGWAGKNKNADDPNEPWAKNAPTHLTRRLVEEFPEREPVWGWRDDAQEIMEQQIDLAADNGVDFFAFCWYWDWTPEWILQKPSHTSLGLYMKARNKDRVRFVLLYCNDNDDFYTYSNNWEELCEVYWANYFKDPQYVTMDGKPLFILYQASRVSNDYFNLTQETAKKAGLTNGLYIAGCGAPDGYDGALPSYFAARTNYNCANYYSETSRPYDDLVGNFQWMWRKGKQPYMPAVSCGFDNRAWEDPNVKGRTYFTGNTPEKFRAHLNNAFTWMDNNPTLTTAERIVLIYAWNELGEGGYLVPTKGDPTAEKLQMIKSVAQERNLLK